MNSRENSLASQNEEEWCIEGLSISNGIILLQIQPLNNSKKDVLF